MQTEPIHIRELRFCCVKYLVIVATCLFAKIVYKSLSRREPCEYASSFIHQKDAGPIKKWWKSRIIMLVDTMNEDGAKALYKEFHIDEKS